MPMRCRLALAAALAASQCGRAVRVELGAELDLDAEQKWESLGEHTTCHADGHVTPADEPANSLQGCKESCLLDAACQGISYNHMANRCTVWQHPFGKPRAAEGFECLRLLSAGEPEAESKEDDPRQWARQSSGERRCKKCADGDEMLDEDQWQSSFLQSNSSVRTFVAQRWPHNTMRYYWDPNISPEAKEASRLAMMEWEAKTCIKFEESTRPGGGVVHFRSDDEGCYAHIGYSPFQSHDMNLGEGCHEVGTAIHEIGHSLGLGHEHQRWDSKDFVEVVEGNVIAEELQDQFYIQKEGEIVAEGIPYDLASIMHYGPHAFTNGEEWTKETRTIRVKHKDVYGNCQIGQREFLSTGDILSFNRWYGCPNRFCADIGAHCSSLAKQGLCDDPTRAAEVRANCPHSCGVCACEDEDKENCPEWAAKGLCPRGDSGPDDEKLWMGENCRKSCGRCSHDDKALCKDNPIDDDPQGCEKNQYEEYDGQPACLNEWFRSNCKKTCRLCPHDAYCWQEGKPPNGKKPTAKQKAQKHWKKLQKKVFGWFSA